MTHTNIMRVDDPVDERQMDLARELDDEPRIVAVSPVPRGSTINVYFEKSPVIPGGIFSKARQHGFVPTEGSFEDAEDLRHRIRAFTGRWESFEQDRLQYIQLAPTGVPEFTCDWCDEHKRGERSCSRWKPESEQSSDGYPKDSYLLCYDCDPHHERDEDGEWQYVAEPDTDRLHA